MSGEVSEQTGMMGEGTEERTVFELVGCSAVGRADVFRS